MMKQQSKNDEPRIGRYIDPKTDFGFKFIFSGAEPSREILIEFLNSLLDGRRHIRELAYGPTEHLGDTAEQKKVIFDLRCRADDDAEIIIEMQRMNHRNFHERVVFSIGRLLSAQYPKGAEYWDFDLPEIYFIGILEFRMDDQEREHYIKNIMLTVKETHATFYDKLTFIFLELPNFAKTGAEIETDIDRWFWLLNNLSRASKIPAFMNKGIFSKVFKISEVSKLKKEEKMAYEASLQDKWLWDSALSLAAERAARVADEKARQEAREEKLDMAREMKNEGISNKQTAKFTKLPIELIEKL